MCLTFQEDTYSFWLMFCCWSNVKIECTKLSEHQRGRNCSLYTHWGGNLSKKKIKILKLALLLGRLRRRDLIFFLFWSKECFLFFLVESVFRSGRTALCSTGECTLSFVRTLFAWSVHFFHSLPQQQNKSRQENRSSFQIIYWIIWLKKPIILNLYYPYQYPQWDQGWELNLLIIIIITKVVELCEVKVDEELLHLLDVGEVARRNLMLLEQWTI